MLLSRALFSSGRAIGHPSINAALLGNVGQVVDDLRAGAIVVFTNDNIRIRRLPIQS